MNSRFAGKRLLLLDGLTSQCLEYTKAFNGLGCDTTVLCDDRFDTCYASKHPKHKILGVSSVRDLKGTEKWILKLVKSGKFDVVIPFTEYSATILSHHKKELSTYAHLIVNDQNVFDYAQDKNNVMKVCMENDLPCPMTIYDAKSVKDILLSNISFPIILKPSHGFGSHGFHKIDTKEALKSCVQKYDIDISKQGNMPNEVEFTLDNKYVVKIGDERFYNLMGETMLSAFNGLVHPDDVMKFEQFAMADMSVKYCIVRCLIKTGTYRWMLLNKKKIYNVGADRMVELVAQDIIVVSNDFDIYHGNVRKYRAIMNVIDEKIFEYDPLSRMLTIY